MTTPKSTTTIATRTNFCATCYLEGIDRICTGFTIVRHDRKRAVAVPPLDPVLAASVRKAATECIEARGQGDAAAHPRHAAGAGVL